MTASSTRPVLVHNPSCSKSRATKALLEERGVEFEEFLYLEKGVELAFLRQVLQALNVDDPREVMRCKEAVYSEMGLADQEGEALLRAIVEQPRLLERPILVVGDRAAIGRPPEQVLEILA